MALIPFGSKDSDSMAVIAWGAVTSDPYYSRVGAKETPKASFYIAYDQDDNETDIKKRFKTIRVELWGVVADWAARLEKRDHVVVFGHLENDEYYTKKSGETVLFIRGDQFVPQASVGMVIDGYKPNDTVKQYSGISYDEETGDVLFGD